jgi:hypothetical protein
MSPPPPPPTLRYRSFVEVEHLALNECTIHRAGDGGSRRWWNLWFYVLRDTDGGPQAFVVPVAPCGVYSENAPGGRTWGLTKVGDGQWQIFPSINVIVNEVGGHSVVTGHAPTGRSLWHHTPLIEGVSDADTWTTGAAP